MLYPFMTLPDDTEIVHSESYIQDGKEHVRVEIEKPIEGVFQSATCILPEYNGDLDKLFLIISCVFSFV